jgi:hypothetical protein
MVLVGMVLFEIVEVVMDILVLVGILPFSINHKSSSSNIPSGMSRKLFSQQVL